MFSIPTNFDCETGNLNINQIKGEVKSGVPIEEGICGIRNEGETPYIHKTGTFLG